LTLLDFFALALESGWFALAVRNLTLSGSSLIVEL
jgi:hypothetical protein